MKDASLIGRRSFGKARLSGIGAALLLVVTLVALQFGGGSAALAAPELTTIAGAVTLNGSGVDNAAVVASRAGFVRTTATSASGAYSLTGLVAGDYTLSVRPAAVTATSPDWVYTGEPALVSVPPAATQDFAVTAATVTVSGRLVAPEGASNATPFAAPNRAWVRAENQEGQGNIVEVAPNGSFSVKTLPGVVLVRVQLENSDWTVSAALRDTIFYAEANETIALDPIAVVAKQALISGTVNVKGAAAAPAGIPVRAWRLDGSDLEQTFTTAGGAYRLPVTAGVWLIQAMPLEQQQYVAAAPPQRVALNSNTAAVTQDLLIAFADVTVNGRTVDSVTGEPLTTGVAGRAYALFAAPGNTRPLTGASAPIENGVFTLKLASSLATTYTIGVFFPPDVAYTALSRVTIDISRPINDPIAIPISGSNAEISGQLQSRSGQAVTDVAGSVWGVSDSGGWARTRVNPADGSYTLPVVTTDLTGAGGSTWAVRAFVDPTSGYIVQRPRLQRVFLPYNAGAGSVATANFTLAEIATFGVISGVVTAPDGVTPLPGVRIAVREFTNNSTTAYDRWTYTDRQGRYQVRVPAGVYRVSAHNNERLRGRPTRNGLVEPAALTVTVAANGQQRANLRFRAVDARVAGQVQYNNQGYPALVQARSSDGAVVAIRTQLDGSFVLGLKADLSWTLQAVGSDGNVFLRSNALTLTPAAAQQPVALNAPLILAPAAVLPESQAFVFAAAEDQIFTMSDGSQVQAPAGAFAAEGQVALTVRPLPELVAVGTVRPVSFGYRLHAFDAERRPITHFLRPITLVIPFSAEQLAALGISVEQLVPAYWDEASASWKPVEQVAVVRDSTGGGTVHITVDHFTDFALLGSTGSSVFQPLVVR